MGEWGGVVVLTGATGPILFCTKRGDVQEAKVKGERLVSEILRGDQERSVFCELVEIAGVMWVLGGGGPIMVFTADGKGVGKFKRGVFAELKKPANQGILSGVMRYHMAEGLHLKHELVALGVLTSLLVEQLGAHEREKRVFVNDVMVVGGQAWDEMVWFIGLTACFGRAVLSAWSWGRKND